MVPVKTGVADTKRPLCGEVLGFRKGDADGRAAAGVLGLSLDEEQGAREKEEEAVHGVGWPDSGFKRSRRYSSPLGEAMP